MNAKDSWQKVYSAGTKYLDEPPIDFTNKIVKTLKEKNLLKGTGLYIGCGNGRNYIPLVQSGLDILGLDISELALGEIAKKLPQLKSKLVNSAFEDFSTEKKFDYIISIQVLQHGTISTVNSNLEKISDLLKPGGLFFLRVHSINSNINSNYDVIENNNGGFTVHFLDGTKTGLNIHYFSKNELNISKHNLIQLSTPQEIILPDTKTKEKNKFKAKWEIIYHKAT